MGDRRAALLHPVAVGALALLLVNDHVLKSAAPGWFSGKLSDVAALVLTPLVGAALWQVIGRRWHAEVWIAVGVGLWFAAVKVLPPANDAYAVVVGILGWPLGVLGDLAANRAIQPIGRAPTVLDPGDLIALPAVAVGWWLAIGAPRHPRSRTRIGRSPACGRDPRSEGLATLGRVAVLAAALAALSATSASVPRTSTVVATDTVTVSGTGDVAQRTGTVVPARPPTASGGEEMRASIRIQARPRWPFNDPPVRFTLTVPGFSSVAGASPVVAIQPDRCGEVCRLPVEVAIDWPDGAGRPSTSVAWELVVTTDAAPNSYLNAGSDSASIDDAARPSSDGGWLLGLLGLAPLAALAFAAEPGPREFAARRGPARALTIGIVAVATSVTAILVVTVSGVASSPGIGAVVGGPADTLGYLAFAAIVGIGWGLFAWRSGSGVVLAVTFAAGGLIGLPIAGFLVAAASPSFAAPGFAIALLTAVLLTLGATNGALRPGNGARPATGGQLIVLSTQVAVAVALLVSVPGFFGLGTLLLAFLHAVAVASWWAGVGRWLGVTSILIGLGTCAAILMRGPSLFLAGPGWSVPSMALQLGVLVGCVIGFGAAFGASGRRDPAIEDASMEARIRELVAESPLAVPSGEKGPPESPDR